MPEPLLYDLKGVARFCIRWIDLERLLDLAFGQIRMYSKTDNAVSMRLLRAFGDIAITTQDPPLRRTLLDRAKRVLAGCEHRIKPEELKQILIRPDALERLTAR